MSRDEVLAEVKAILADLARDQAVLSASPDTPLLREGVGLDSLGGTLLLVRVKERFGVDVAGEDLNLDSMASIGALSAFVANRITSR
ncbi:MAG TPA: phosphopantetheine-binding protein [Streptosporangiaceae bacterium]|nr:phosphopantetheine-binding protein [Streptosporangiaceae bacterium]